MLHEHALTATIGRAHERALASLFSPCVAVACLDATATPVDSSFADEPWFQQAAASRRQEFSGGRVCTKQVLRALGQPPVAIARGAQGEPVWPVGVVGSISHAEGLCVAVGARASDVGALGVDIEPDRMESAAFARRVCSERELSSLTSKGLPIEAFAPVMFSAKEASYKLQFPLTRDAGAWAGLEVLLMDDENFSVRFQDVGGPLAGRLVRGRWRRALGFIWAGVSLLHS